MQTVFDPCLLSTAQKGWAGVSRGREEGTTGRAVTDWTWYVWQNVIQIWKGIFCFSFKPPGTWKKQLALLGNGGIAGLFLSSQLFLKNPGWVVAKALYGIVTKARFFLQLPKVKSGPLPTSPVINGRLVVPFKYTKGSWLLIPCSLFSLSLFSFSFSLSEVITR